MDQHDDDYYTNGRHKIIPLELEDAVLEEDSLIRETADFGRAASIPTLVLRRRAAGAPHSHGTDRPSFVQGLLRGNVGSHLSYRNLTVLAILAICAFLLMNALQGEMSNRVPEQTVNKKPPGSSSFGDTKNENHYKPSAQNTVNDDQLPKSNIGHAVWSLSVDNYENKNGHYLHDPYLSPYASPKYASLSTEEQTSFQADFDARRLQTIQQYGVWKDPDPQQLQAPDTLYLQYEYRDIPSAQFPENSWQRDAPFQRALITQRLKLIDRVKKGIYAEYGWALNTSDVSDSQRKRRDAEFGVIGKDNAFDVRDGMAIDPKTGQRIPGVAFLSNEAWKALERKLLHAMMTQDEFFVVVVGSAATYRANNFFQSQIMQFNYIMEPVMDLMGVKLIVRNMGMDASTTVSALGGADIYGEADILWYIPDTRPDAVPESDGQIDLLQKQAILSGERMPIILTPNPVWLMKNSNNKAWMGNIQPGTTVCDETKIVGSAVRLPAVKACQYIRCNQDALKKGACDRYNSVCWVNRTDFLDVKHQDKDVGFQHDGYPNFRQHQWESRKLAMLILQGLEKALNTWNSAKTVPLPDDLWHVGKVYEELRNSIRELEVVGAKSACEELLSGLDPAICHMSMSALTEWTPRVRPEDTSISYYLLDEVNDRSNILLPLYYGPDLLPLEWKLGDDETDVHMIAIAMPNKTSETDDSLKIRGYEDEYTEPYSDDAMYFGPEYDDLFDIYNDDGGGWGRFLRERKVTSDVQKRWTRWNAPIGFCDGSAQSMCNRRIGSSCLLANYNHYKAGILGTGESNWLEIDIPIKEGVILVRFDWQLDLTDQGLGNVVDNRLQSLPGDLKFEYKIADTLTTLNKKRFLDFGYEVSEDVVVYPLLVDKKMSHTEVPEEFVRVALRFSTGQGDDFRVLLTHVYFA